MSYLTEAEARQRWCPFVRAAFPANTIRMRPDIGENVAEQLPAAAVGNRPIEPNCRCIASECMAWRWRDPDGWSGTPEDQRKGFCGLAGRLE